MIKILIGLAFVFCFPTLVQAKTSLIVKPAIIRLETDSSSASVTLYNSGDRELALKYATLWLESGKDGKLYPSVPIKTVAGITALNQEAENGEFTLLPRSSRNLLFTIPKEIKFTNKIPGLIFTTIPEAIPADKTASSLAGSIIVPILRLGDTGKQELKVSSFTTTEFTTNNKLPFALTVNNPGKVLTQVSGTIVVKNIINQPVARFSLPEYTLLPQQYRDLISGEKIVWDPKLILGIYQVELQLNYGDKSTIHRKMIFGLPYNYALVLGVFALLISGIYLRVRKYRT